VYSLLIAAGFCLPWECGLSHWWSWRC